MFQVDVPVHILAGPVGQGQCFQIIVFGNEAAAITGEIGIVAQIQMGEAVVIQMDKLQLFEHGKVDLGEAVVKGLDEFQIGVGGKIHGCQVIAAAVDDFQCCAAGQFDGGHMIVFTKQCDQLVQTGYIQTADAVGFAVQITQGSILTNIQLGQLIIVAAELFKGVKYLDSFQ